MFRSQQPPKPVRNEQGQPLDPKTGEPLKPCCSCPDTKRLRDECVLLRGEENCGELIEQHKTCLRDLGFIIP